MLAGVAFGQATDIVGAHLGKNPQTQHQSGSWLVLQALAQAFPAVASGGLRVAELCVRSLADV